MATNNTGTEALARSRKWTRYEPKGMCARHVSDSVSNGAFGYDKVSNAKDAWDLATQKEYDRNPPAGAPMYFSTPWPADHIALSTGNPARIVRSTDYPTNELLGECTIPQMEARWPGTKYLGWSRDFAGDPIPGLEKPKPTPKPPVVPATPTPPKESNPVTRKEFEAEKEVNRKRYELSTKREEVHAERYQGLFESLADAKTRITALEAKVND